MSGRRRAGFPTLLRWPLALALATALALWACETETDVEQPVPLYDRVPIDYPMELWDRGVEGRTLVRVRVTTAGRVDSVQVVESSGHAAFDSAAIRGARQLFFRPARSDDEPVRVWATVPVHFSREESRADSTPP